MIIYYFDLLLLFCYTNSNTRYQINFSLFFFFNNFFFVSLCAKKFISYPKKKLLKKKNNRTEQNRTVAAYLFCSKDYKHVVLVDYSISVIVSVYWVSNGQWQWMNECCHYCCGWKFMIHHHWRGHMQAGLPSIFFNHFFFYPVFEGILWFIFECLFVFVYLPSLLSICLKCFF